MVTHLATRRISGGGDLQPSLCSTLQVLKYLVLDPDKPPDLALQSIGVRQVGDALGQCVSLLEPFNLAVDGS
jgi:hypothetical protein